jgi:creatinine amidohydrolase
MAFRFWRDLASPEFGALNTGRTVTVLPLCATEQHGPHLPTGTDTMIAHGLTGEVARRFEGDFDLLFLPALSIGASQEHARFAGTISVSTPALIEQISAIGGQVAASGLKKLVLVSSHGGNVAAMSAAALACRQQHGLLAVTLTWLRLGLPAGAVDAGERETGIHGGFVETSLMLHFRPELVQMDKAEDFSSLQSDLAGRYRHLRAHGPVGFGWLAGDLNPSGAVGDAASANAEAGRDISSHQADAFIALAGEVSDLDLASTFG